MNSAWKDMFDSVRSVLGGRIADEGEIRDLAWRVAEFTSGVRRRAERSVEYSRAGLRLEAVAEAEAEPDIEQAAAGLISDEMRQWRAYCTKYGHPVPDALSDDLVAEIQEAKEQLRPLRSRLAKMRRLVLADASAWDRLGVLRELRHRDPDNAAWTDSMMALEPLAADEIGERFQADLRSGDLEGATTCVDRLSDGQWAWSGASRLASQLRARLDERRVAELVTVAEVAVDRMETERIAEDAQAARAQLGTLRDIEQRLLGHGGELPARISSRISAVESWLAERDAADAAARESRESADALAELAMDESSTLARLRVALRAAEQTVEGVPDDVRAIAERRIEELEGRVRRRRMALAAAVVLVVAGGIVATVFAIQRTAFANRVQVLADSAMQQVREDRLAEAETALREAEAEPAVAGHPEIVKVRSELAARRAAVADKHRRFEALLAEAGDPSSEGARPDRIQQITEQGLVQDAEEQSKVVAWQRAHARAGEGRTQAQRDAALSRTKELSAQILASEPDASAAWDGRFAAWDSELGDIERQAGTFAEVREAADRGRQLVAQKRESAKQARIAAEQARRLESIATQAGQPALLAKALLSFRESFPDSPQAADFQAAAAALPSWEAALAMQSVQPVPSGALATAPQAQREAMRTALERYLARHPSSPYRADVARVVDLLAPATGWREEFIQRLKQRDCDLYAVERKDGTRFYTVLNPARASAQGSGGRKVLQVAKSAAFDEALLEVPQDRVRWEGESPQRKLRPQVRELIDGGAAGNDVQVAFAVLRALAGAKDMDPLLQCSLLAKLLDRMSSEMPPELKEPMSTASARLGRELPEGADWIADAYLRTRTSVDEEVARRPARVQAALSQALDLDGWWAAYQAALAQASRPFERAWEPAGVLLAAGGKPAFVRAPGIQVAPGTELFAIEPAPAEKAGTRFVPVGTASDEGSVTFGAAAGELPQGTMLFVRKGGGKA